MNREKVYFFAVVVIIILLLGGYLGLRYYKSAIIGAINPESRQGETNSAGSGGGTSISGASLPVTEQPNDSSAPINPGQIPLGLENNQSGGQKSDAQQAAVPLDASKWNTYRNKKYQYSFKYPTEFDYRECSGENPCKFGQIFEKDGGDLAYISAQTKERSWPYITVAHYDNENLTLAKDQKLIDWIKSKFQGSSVPKDYNYEIKAAKGDPKKAIRIDFPQTPQAHSKEEIYFAIGNNIFQIQMLDTNKSEAWAFYNPWLESFILE